MTLSDSSLNGFREMVVDDDAETRELLSAMLSEHGAKVKACGSAFEALTQIELWLPTVVVSDIGMPNQDGYYSFES